MVRCGEDILAAWLGKAGRGMARCGLVRFDEGILMIWLGKVG